MASRYSRLPTSRLHRASAGRLVEFARVDRLRVAWIDGERPKLPATIEATHRDPAIDGFEQPVPFERPQIDDVGVIGSIAMHQRSSNVRASSACPRLLSNIGLSPNRIR